MNFYSNVLNYFTWLSGSLRHFLSGQVLRCVFVVLASLFSRIFTLVAFVLPLKIVLLASSSGVPHYLSSIVSISDKTAWIVGLTIASFIFYAASIALDFIGKRQVQVAARSIVQWDAVETEPLAVARADGHFSTICDFFSGVFFAFLGLVTLAFCNILLFLTLLGLVSLELILTAFLMGKQSDGEEQGLRKFILTDLRGYLTIFSSINFLMGCVVLVIPYVLGGSGNILLSIISLIVTRQVLSALVSGIAASVKIGKNRDRIEAIFTHNLTGGICAPSSLPNYQDVNAEERCAYLSHVVGDCLAEPSCIDHHWVDCSVRDISSFKVNMVSGAQGPAKDLIVRIFAGNVKNLYDREQELFESASRARLLAPVQLKAGVDDNGNRWQVLLASGSNSFPMRDWPDFARKILAQHWSYMPPEALKQTFMDNNSLIFQRLNKQKLGKLAIAASGRHEIDLIQRTLEVLPEIQDFLKVVPYYIHNQDFQCSNVFVDSDAAELQMLNWGRWTIEAIGSIRPIGAWNDDIVQMIERAKVARDDFPGWFNLKHFEFIYSISQIEKFVMLKKYRAGLDILKTLNQDSSFADFFIYGRQAIEA